VDDAACSSGVRNWIASLDAATWKGVRVRAMSFDVARKGIAPALRLFRSDPIRFMRLPHGGERSKRHSSISLACVVEHATIGVGTWITSRT
jgi:hypothetical protein